MMIMSSGKSSYFMFFGIIFGLCLGLVIRNHRALEIVKRCDSTASGGRHPFEIIQLPPNDTVHNSQRNLLFVGVMTAKNFLQGRAKAVYDTWGKEVPGRIAFFSSAHSHSTVLPVIALPGVDDRYPPQKKSFMMLYYMYEHFIDKFEWFARTDDDVYINTAKLERLLRSVDSSKPQFIGQAGKGNTEEFGLLSLEFDENFCMGGPGVILSRETLKRVAPHIPTCLQNLYSTHEDVEIGRCVQKFAGIPCTWNYEMQSILHHNSSGRFAFTGNLKSKEIHNAITLHPVKMAPLMYRLHAYMQGLRAQELRQQALQLHRDIAAMKTLLTEGAAAQDVLSGMPPIFPEGPESDRYLGDHSVLSKEPNLKKHEPQHASELQLWNFIGRSFYSADQSNPKKKLDSSFREGLEDVITEVMDNINNFSRQRGRVIEFRELLYGYSRVNSLYGHDLVLDLLLIYKKYRGKKMTVPVRRHLYIQRAFTDVFVREINETHEDHGLRDHVETEEEINRLALLSAKVKNLWNTGLERFGELTNGDGSKATSAAVTYGSMENKKIVFVLSLAGRFATFVRFMKNYEEVCLQSSQNTELLIVLFDDNKTNMTMYYDHLTALNDRYFDAAINIIRLGGAFSRGRALDTAARSEYIAMNDIIYFVDVDITFRAESLDRIRLNTIAQKQVYLPIVFSQYDPQRVGRTLTESTSAGSDDIGQSAGYFRQFGYGICSIYKSDIMNAAINGFNTDITGWGLEDVKFLEQIVRLNQQPRQLLLNLADNNTTMVFSNATTLGPTTTHEQQPSQHRAPLRLSVFRSPDPSLVHVYHPIECDPNLDDAQLQMCIGTKANTLGSYAHIESVLLNSRRVVERFRAQTMRT